MSRVHSRVAGVLGVSLLLGVALIGTLGSSPARAGTDPEPTLKPNIVFTVDPGPGLPAGWTPPPAPTTLPALVEDAFNANRQTDPTAPQHLEMRVIQPPYADWTKEYPWNWIWAQINCGSTEYIVYHPAPDLDLILQVFRRSYSFFDADMNPDTCQMAFVQVIKESKAPTPDQKEQQRLDNLLDANIGYAQLGGPNHGGLQSCQPYAHEGTTDNVYVCFNAGSASERFDAPAYLDTQVNRVRVPVRFVSEMMRANVTWDGATQTVTIHVPAASHDVVHPIPLPGGKFGDWVVPNDYSFDGGKWRLELQTVSQPERTIVLTVGKNSALVDGQEVPLDAPPVIVPPGRTMVPVRFISEVMGAKVYWIGNDPIYPDVVSGTLAGRYQVHIYTPLWPYFEYPDWFLETRARKF
ncbi:MAG TPA: copper amine oxidase N-terminal domain-containing protein [Symbiobacteriaceae bacterium]